MTPICIAVGCDNASPSTTVHRTESRPEHESLLCPHHWVTLPYSPFRIAAREIAKDQDRGPRYWVRVAILKARIALYEKKWTAVEAATYLHQQLDVLDPGLTPAFRATLTRQYPSLKKRLT